MWDADAAGAGFTMAVNALERELQPQRTAAAVVVAVILAKKMDICYD